jgi:hypothetical protein
VRQGAIKKGKNKKSHQPGREHDRPGSSLGPVLLQVSPECDKLKPHAGKDIDHSDSIGERQLSPI